MASLAPVRVAVVTGGASPDFDAPAVDLIVNAIVAAQRTTAAVAPRSRLALRRAARHGLLLAAHRGDSLIGWAIGERSGSGVIELGSLYVVPQSRDGLAMRELTALGTGLCATSVVVTMDQRFATWLRSEWGFAPSTLWGVTRATRGIFLVRRLAPWRLIAALRHVAVGPPYYLIRCGEGGA